jgi:hypothetical protein
MRLSKDGIMGPLDPNNHSDDAESTYEVKVNSGKLLFWTDLILWGRI